MQLVSDSNIALNCQFKLCQEYAVKQRWSHNLYTQNTYKLLSSDNTMPSTRKSPRRNLGMRPNFYGTDGDQDHVEITRGKVRVKQPSKKRPPRGYKKPRKQLQAPARLSWKCHCFRCCPQLVLTTCLRVFPTHRPDTAGVLATSCDVGSFFLCRMSCRCLIANMSW